jgi:hypothetical protein
MTIRFQWLEADGAPDYIARTFEPMLSVFVFSGVIDAGDGFVQSGVGAAVGWGAVDSASCVCTGVCFESGFWLSRNCFPCGWMIDYISTFVKSVS